MKSPITKTLNHVALLSRHLERCNLRGAIIVVLMELGVPTKCIGFEFLKYAILLQCQNPTRALSNDIYLEITEYYDQNSEEQVQQAIRDAIKMAWRHGSRDAWSGYFSYDDIPIPNKPSNSEFISKIAYILELWQDCR